MDHGRDLDFRVQPYQFFEYVLQIPPPTTNNAYVSAVDRLTKQLNANPRDPHTYEIRAAVYNAIGASDLALDDNNKAITLLKASPSKLAGAFYRRAYTYNCLGKADLALKDCTETLRLSKEPGLVYVVSQEQARAHIWSGQTLFAIEDLQKQLQENPISAATYKDLSECYKNLGNDEVAKNYMNTAGQLAYVPPSGPPSIPLIGGVPEHKRWLEEANRQLKQDPKNANALRLRGESYMVLKQPDKAMEDYNLAVKLNPNDPWNYRMRASAFFQSKKPDEAIQDINKAITLADPQMKNMFLMIRAGYYRHSSKYEEAIADYTILIDHDKQHGLENCFNYADRGECYKRLDNLEAAKSDFSRAKELDSLGSLKSTGEPKDPPESYLVNQK
jgi:tetratricopeptide (TPR) repeat protein